MNLNKRQAMQKVNRAYRHRIQFLDYVSKMNDLGMKEQVLVPVLATYADITPIRSRETSESGVLKNETFYRILSYYRPDIKPDLIIKWGDKHLEIDGFLDDDGKEMHMTIIAKEVDKPSGSRI